MPSLVQASAIAAGSAACDRKLISYRTALDAGGDPVTISCWVTEVTAERVRYKAQARPAAPRAQITRGQIAEAVTALGGSWPFSGTPTRQTSTATPQGHKLGLPY